jgi:PhnB protein
MANETENRMQPQGVVPYLTVSDAKAASSFYQRAFAAAEMDRRPTEDGRLMHCQLLINGGSLMMSDGFPEHGYPAMPAQGYVLHLQVADPQAWWDRAVEAGATVTMPIKLEFWGDMYGQLKDPFGITWAIGGSPKQA